MSFRRLSLAPFLTALLASCVPGGEESERTEDEAQALMAGAGYTTFDPAVGGCLDSRDGVTCNTYAFKDAVYLGGGPSTAGLPDGEYFFAVLAPGHQRNGFREGAEGNLSDLKAGGTRFDQGSGDALENRTFHVLRRQIWPQPGDHRVGTNSLGRTILRLTPFDDSDNRDGDYILAICPTGAASSSECKLDAFRIQGAEAPEPGVATVSGMVYYDLDTDGQLDVGEPPIGGWVVGAMGGATRPIRTDEEGMFRVRLGTGSYRFGELSPLPGQGWMQTGNLVDQSRSTRGASADLVWDKTYVITVAGDAAVVGLFFGNVCLGPGGGHSKGFWANRHGEALFEADDLEMLRALNLRTEDGRDFNPYRFDAFRHWLLGANAENMANMLSAQLAAMALNVHNGFVDASALVYAPGIGVANANGFNTVAGLVRAANDMLLRYPDPPKGSPERAAEEAVKDALEAANDDTTFVQRGPESCPMLLF